MKSAADNMTVDKFGRHLTKSTETENERHQITLVDISQAKLTYDLIIQFFGTIDHRTGDFLLFSTQSPNYKFPLSSGIIKKVTFQTEDIILTVNGHVKEIPISIKEGDLLSFHESSNGKLLVTGTSEFSGDVVITMELNQR